MDSPVKEQGELGGACKAPWTRSSAVHPTAKEETKTRKRPWDRTGEIAPTCKEPDWSKVFPRQWLPQYLPPNPLLRWQPEDVKKKRHQAQEPKFLFGLERTLKKKLEDIDGWIREHNPGNESLRQLISRTQNDVKVIKDSI